MNKINISIVMLVTLSLQFYAILGPKSLSNVKYSKSYNYKSNVHLA